MGDQIGPESADGPPGLSVDSKLSTREVLDYINRRQGRFIAVLPRTRREDPEFRAWLQTHEPAWEEVRNLPHPRRQRGPRDIWRVWRDPLPSLEGWRVIWVWSSLGALHQEHARRERIARATQDLQALQQKLRGPRPRRDRAQVDHEVQALLDRLAVTRYLKVTVEEAEHQYRQEHRGRPGPETRLPPGHPPSAALGVDHGRQRYRVRSEERWDVSAAHQRT
jgi:hypothetical protein